MISEEFLRYSFVALEVNDAFSEAVLVMSDQSRLCFRHRVGERWARADGAGETAGQPSLAGKVLALMTQFRLNAKHLEVEFQDGSRWEARFRGSTREA
jgi:hypothetical protein